MESTEESQETSCVYTLSDVVKELRCINEKLSIIDKKLHTERDSLVELLRDIVTTGLRNTIAPRDDNKQETVESDLYYTIVEDNIFIKGKKTYQNKDKIKNNLNGTWNKEKSAWSFKKFDNFEEKLKEEFPDITEGQS